MSTLRNWLSLEAAHPAFGQALVFVLLLLVMVVRAAMHRTRVHRRLDSAMTLIAFGLVCGEIAAISPERAGIFLYAEAVFIAAVGIGLARTLLVLFVDYHLRETRGAGVSTIVRDVGSVLVYFFIIILVLRFTLDINLGSLVATSAVLTAIVGLSLQDVLSSVISGLVLELEDPFDPGDWVRVGTFEGRVVETGWRTTKIRTRVNEFITLPNTYLAREPVVNYSRPDPRYGDTLRFEAAYEAPPHSVKEAIHRVLAADPAVLSDPFPEVRTSGFRENGIEYAVRYWIDNFTDLERIRDRLMTNYWYALRRAGIRIPYPARDLFVHSEAIEPAIAAGDVAATLARVSLLDPLTPGDIEKLAASARRMIFGRDEAIVREGDRGDSFYVIERGGVRIVLGQTNGERGKALAQLGPGDFFGEMSMLAGDPRSATVVADEDTAVVEVGQAAFQQIVAANPAVLEPISQLAARRLSAQQEFRRTAESFQTPGQDPNAQRILQRIRTFFGV